MNKAQAEEMLIKQGSPRVQINALVSEVVATYHKLVALKNDVPKIVGPTKVLRGEVESDDCLIQDWENGVTNQFERTLVYITNLLKDLKRYNGLKL